MSKRAAPPPEQVRLRVSRAEADERLKGSHTSPPLRFRTHHDYLRRRSEVGVSGAPRRLTLREAPWADKSGTAKLPALQPHPLPAGARPDRAHAPLGLRRVSRPGAACLAPLVPAKTRDGWVIFGRGSGSNPGHAGRSRESLRRATRGLASVLDEPAPVNPHPADRARARFRARRFGRDIDLTVGRERHSTDSPRGQSSIGRCPRPASIV